MYFLFFLFTVDVMPLVGFNLMFVKGGNGHSQSPLKEENLRGKRPRKKEKHKEGGRLFEKEV